MHSRDLVLKTAKYRAISLNEIEFDSSSFQLASHAVDDVCNDGEEPESDSEMEMVSKRFALLKRTVGHASQSSKKSKSSGSKTKQPAKSAFGCFLDLKPGKSKSNNRARQEPEVEKDPNQPGMSGDAHQHLVQEWSHAKEADLGILPSRKGQAKATPKSDTVGPLPGNVASSSSCATTKTLPTAAKTTTASSSSAVPIQSYVLPWKDEKGYCWIYNEESQLPYPLGSVLRNLDSRF